MSIEVYSDKSLVVYGLQTVLKDQLEALGGSFSSLIKHPSGARKTGWIFDKSKQAALQSLLENNKQEEQEEKEVTKASASITLSNAELQKYIVDLQRRVEALEGEVSALTKLVTSKESIPKTVSRPATAASATASVTTVAKSRAKFFKKEEESEEESEEEEEGSVLMAMKKSKQLVRKPIPENKKK